jgi:hypothetical protein
MAVTWTEAFSSFVPVGTGWQNYDIFTNNSVPKGAIAHIVIGSVNQTAARTVGVRTDGSALNRYIKLHESEGTTTGANCCSYYVKVDATTGFIETYADNVTGITFYLMGYWTGVDYTELMQALTLSVAATWTDVDLTAYATDARVCEIQLNNLNDGAQATMGIRTNGSAVVRYVTLHEAESATVEATDVTTFSMCVKSDAGGIVEYYTSTTTSVSCNLVGYFGSEMDYVENIQTGSISATGWTDWDLTAYLDMDGRVAEVLSANSTTNAPANYGVRVNGSALSRYIAIHESETSATNGYVTACGTDTGGILELYGSNASNEYFRYLGYFKNTITKSINNLSDTRFYKTQETTKLSDSRFRKTYEITKTSDNGLKKTQESTKISDGRFKTTQPISKYSDAIVSAAKTTYDIYKTSDTRLRKTNDITKLGDTRYRKVQEFVKVSDSRTRNTYDLTKFVDNRFKTNPSITKLSDTRLFKNQTLTKVSDSRYRKTIDITKNADTRLKKTNEIQKTSDDRFRKTYEVNKTSDERFKRTWDILKTSDARIGGTGAVTYTINKSSDSRFKYLANEITKNSNTRLLKTQSVSKVSDTRFKHLAWEQTKTSDTRFLKTGSINKLSDARVQPDISTLSFIKLSDTRFSKPFTLTKYSNSRVCPPVITKTSNAFFYGTVTIVKTSSAYFKVTRLSDEYLVAEKISGVSIIATF